MCHPQLTTTFPPYGQTSGPVELLELRVRVWGGILNLITHLHEVAKE